MHTSADGNTSIDGTTGTLNIINSGFYKVTISFSIIAVSPAPPTSINVLLYGNTTPLTYFALQTLSSNVIGFSPSGNICSTTMRMWSSGTTIPLRFNWFVSGSASFVFSPIYISVEKIGDYSASPTYP